jgi:hypothetical protein
LDTGTLACRAEPGDTVHYYEIDPAMIRLATDPKNFSFLDECRPVDDHARRCPAHPRRSARTESYDVIIVDAFTSDAIPIHLSPARRWRSTARSSCRKASWRSTSPTATSELASVVAGIAKANDMVSRCQRRHRRDRERR